MAVITISRQYGSGGSTIAQLTAEHMGWQLVDNQFVDRVAEELHLPAEEVARRENRRPSLIERLAANLAASSPENILASAETTGEHATPDLEMHRLTQAVILEAVQHDHAVLVGRGAQFYLRNREDALHVLVVAPRDVRARRIQKRLGVTAKEADKKVADVDSARRDYVATHYKRKWADPASYHLVINSGFLDYRQAADLVVASARSLWEERRAKSEERT